MTKSPLISIIMASYNHESYIKQTIDSVLNQSFSDFEFIITDDGSKDKTVDVIKQFNDPRIKFFGFETNQGACIAMNHCVENAIGEYIAVINSDDFWHKDKLTEQLKIFNSNPRISAVFTEAVFVDEHGQPFKKSEVPSFHHLFKQENRSRGKWLRKFFLEDNCLCHPSILIKKECYDEIGLYNNRYRQAPDFDMWIRLIKRFDIHILNKELVYFRLLPHEQNASNQINTENWVRTMNERYLIAIDFFNNVSKEMFIDGFSDLLEKSTIENDDEFEIEKALLYLKNHSDLNNIYHLIGLQKLFQLLNNDTTAKILNKIYNINDKSIHLKSGQFRLFRDLGIKNLQDEIRDLQSTIHLHNTQVKSLKNELSNIYNSNSWKLAVWLQKIMRLFRA